MTEILQILTNSTLAEGFVNWYDSVYGKKIELGIFINLPSTFQYQVVHEFIVETYSIGLNYDSVTVVIYTTRPEVHVNQILAKYNKGGKFTTILQFDCNLPNLNITSAFKRGILKLITYIERPPF